MLEKFKSSWNKFDWPHHVWMSMDLLVDHWSMAVSSSIARIQLYLRGCKRVGNGLRVKGRLHVFSRRNYAIEIGDNVTIVSRFRSNPVGITNPCVLDTLMGGRIEIGGHVGLSGVILSSRSLIRIGDYVKLGGNVRVFDHNYHSLDWERRRNAQLDSADVRTDPVVIEDDVFVGAHAIILQGTHIGARSIVGAGAVVAGLKVPSDSLVIGNPARIVNKKPYACCPLQLPALENR